MSETDTSLDANVIEEEVTFTLSGAMLGAKRAIPVAVSDFAIGLVFGVLVAIRSKNVLLAMVVGVAGVWVLRHFL